MKKISLLLLIVAILFSCDENTDNKIGDENPIKKSLQGPTTDFVLQNYLNQFDFDNVWSYVSTLQVKYNNSDGISVYTGVENSAYARFYDDYGNAEVNLISINGRGLVDVGSYSYQLSGTDVDSLDLNYGSGENRIAIDNLANVSVLDTNVSFSTPILLTNFTLMQNISKSQDFNLTWTGVDNNSIIQCKFLNDTANTIGANAGLQLQFIQNSGSHLIKKEGLSYLPLGLTSLIVDKHEIKMLDRADGQKVALHIVSQYYTKVNIVP